MGNLKKSALRGAKYCPCGTVTMSLDMEELVKQTSHKTTLLEIADILDSLCFYYECQKRESQKKRTKLKLVKSAGSLVGLPPS
ncbi:MAG: hypothetical protein AAF203_03375 [Pseudomonadota bacterium]